MENNFRDLEYRQNKFLLSSSIFKCLHKSIKYPFTRKCPWITHKSIQISQLSNNPPTEGFVMNGLAQITKRATRRAGWGPKIMGFS